VIEAVLSPGYPPGGVPFPIGVAREAIARSGGRVDWTYAGETWARIVPSDSGTPGSPL